MSIAFVRILCRMDFPSTTVRFWDGSGPYIDEAGNLWRQGSLADGGLDQIEMAINGEAFTLLLGLSGIDPPSAALAWDDYRAGNIIGSTVRILTQDFDANKQMIGAAKVRFTGEIDDIDFEDSVQGDTIMSSVMVSVTNRFALRNLTSGSVLSDVDQKARAFKLNGNPVVDRICERIVLMLDKTIKWPKWS